MRLVGLVIAIALVALSTGQAFAQNVADSMAIAGSAAATWQENDTNIIEVTGPVTIDLDRTKLTADKAVIWMRPSGGTAGDQQKVEVSLVGNAIVKQGEATRSGGTLFVTAMVNGAIRITAGERTADSLANSDLYKSASALRQANQSIAAPAAGALVPTVDKINRAMPVTQPPANAVPLPPPAQQITFQADTAPFMVGPDGRIVIVMNGHLLLMIDRPKGERVEMQAEHMVVYTTFKSLSEAHSAGANIKDKLEAVYLEGDVRLDYTPPTGPKPVSGQRMTAERAYYELNTDRAILTDAVFHTVDPKTQIPVIMRADTLRQLAQDHFEAEGVRMTTSTFANPSFAVAASTAYVTREETGDPRLGDRYNFSAWNVRPQFFGVPVFYMPVAGGSITQKGFPLREISFGSSNHFGESVETEWGLAETLGYPSPKDLDISYRLDYFSDRGPAGGIDAKYSGGFITESTRQPWNFSGEFKSYFVDDHGVDKLGGDRADVDPDDSLRGRVLWEHQHFLPDDWQVQTRVSYVSDPTFLEEWFPHEFQDGLPENESFYAKRQRDSEALTLLVDYQPNNIITDAEFAQEQAEVAHLPEIGYRRIGDSFADDNLTFYSDNLLSALEFQKSSASLAQQGYLSGQTPGIPATGQTGMPGSVTFRGDFRQEVDYPINAGHFKIMPYTFARLTDYSDSPSDGTQNRLFVGGGFRLNTAFWQTDDAAESNLFDIHRVRHVIEPELNVFASGETTDADSLYIYDQEIDDIHDVSAVNLALNQRWQTKRGGPGKWRSVDFFTFNVSATFYANKPPDSELPPGDFRGLYFPSAPETSIPRDAINADASWRISDDTVLIADEQYNTDEQTLATAAIGLAVRRDERLSYTVGNSYIHDLHSNITSVGLTYELSKKYTFGYYQSFDFGQDENVNFSTTVTRKFDTFAVVFRVNHDEITGESSVGVNLQPVGANGSFGTDSAQAFANQKR